MWTSLVKLNLNMNEMNEINNMETMETSTEPLTQVLSPKQLARVIGASESSLKRWIDGGQIQALRTNGGHRRISLAEAVRFIRDRHHEIADPSPLGLSTIHVDETTTLDQRLYEALTNHDAATARTLLVTAYVSGIPLTQLCDGPLRQALERIGTLWNHGNPNTGIAIEHQAIDTCVHALNHLRGYMPTVTLDAPVALGGAPAGDPYLIPSLMASMTFDTCGYRTFNLGPNTPLDALRNAAMRQRPKLVWLSVCSPDGLGTLHQPLMRFADELADLGAALIIGGRQSDQLTLEPRANIKRTTNLTDAAAFAGTLLTRR